jgi:hypothetical protein
MISERLLSIVRCADCRGTLRRSAPPSQSDDRPADIVRLTCSGCGRQYDSPHDFLDLRPREAFAEQTKYLDETLHADARHERVSPPLLGSRIRNDMLRQFLSLAPGERAIDLGCGSGLR